MKAARRSLLALFLALVLFLTLAGGSAGARTYDPEETRFLELINAYRLEHGLSALRLSGIVSEAAARHSLDMGTYGFFSHMSERSSFFERVPLPGSAWPRWATAPRQRPRTSPPDSRRPRPCSPPGAPPRGTTPSCAA